MSDGIFCPVCHGRLRFECSEPTSGNPTTTTALLRCFGKECGVFVVGQAPTMETACVRAFKAFTKLCEDERRASCP